MMVDQLQRGINLKADLEKLRKYAESTNLVPELDEQELTRIGMVAIDGYNTDLSSRTGWESKVDSWMDLAMQVTQEKSFPWPGAANVKYPLLTLGAMQFQARSYAAMLGDVDIVKARVLGLDPTGQAADKAIRIGKHMSYQLLVKNPDWEEGMDKMLLSLPIVGCMFKKTYHCPLKDYNVSDIIYPKQLVVDYNTQTLETAVRISHVLTMSQNTIKEKMMAGLYADIDLPAPDVTHDDSFLDASNTRMGVTDTTTATEDVPRIIIEQHMYWDLDDDGYKEPYIIVVDLTSKKVLRMVARYTEAAIEVNEDGTLRRIVPEHYFTKFTFIPNPDGSFYDIGFGILLGPINETINTLINQLIDSGTLSNMQGGFLSRQVKMKAGDTNFKPGEWKPINSSGDDIKKGIFPLPLREPSGVLFNLLNLLITSGKEISSITEMMQGQVPGQNTKATVAVQAVQEGMRIFNSIYKRIYRSLGKEYKKMFILNARFLNPREEFTVLGLNQGSAITIDDYRDGNIDVIPGADPQMATEEQRSQKAQQLGQLLEAGLINREVAVKRILEAQQQPGIEELMQMPPPQPNPEIVLKQQEQQWKQQKETGELQLKAQELQVNAELRAAQALLAQTQAEVAAKTAQLNEMTLLVNSHQKQQQMVLDQHNSDADRQVKKNTSKGDNK